MERLNSIAQDDCTILWLVELGLKINRENYLRVGYLNPDMKYSSLSAEEQAYLDRIFDPETGELIQ